jgi:hypothetical protein
MYVVAVVVSFGVGYSVAFNGLVNDFSKIMRIPKHEIVDLLEDLPLEDEY